MPAKPPGHALAPDRVPGQHAVALEEHPGHGHARRRRRRSRRGGPAPGATRLHRPWPRGGPRAASDPRRGRLGPGRPGPGRRRAGRGDGGPDGGEGVIGHLTGPHQVPQGLEHLAVAPAPAPPSSRKKQAPRSASTSRTWSWMASAGRPSGRRPGPKPEAGQEQTGLVPKGQHHPAVVAAEGAGAHPQDLAGGQQLVEQPGRVAVHPGTGRRRARGRWPAMATPWSWPITSYSRSSPPVAAMARPPVRGRHPCQAGRNRARASADVGSTCWRSTASERCRRIRRTSTSHHSRSTPSGRNAPRSSRPVVDQAGQHLLHRGRPHAEPGGRLAGHERPVGPAPPADQLEQGVVDRGEEGVGQTGRRRHPEPVAVAAGVLAGDQPVLAGDPHPDGPAVGQQLGRRRRPGRPARPARRRSGRRAGAGGRGRPRRSWPASARRAPAARPPAGSRAPPSSRSRSSSEPTSSASMRRSRVRAWARRSASGESPSYMNWAT